MRSLVRLVVAVLLAGAGLAATVVALGPPAAELLAAGHGTSNPELSLRPLAQRSLIFASDGSLLAALHAEQNRATTPLADVPQGVIDAVLAVEDEHFFEHRGVNLSSTARALLANLSSGGIEQGGSTITQQVVKNSILTPQRDAGRKLREAILALRLEEQMSKEEILERYLNTVYFGNGVYGLQAAAELYWGIDATALDAGQGALLAAIIRNPAAADPFTNPDRARARRDLALDRMQELGMLTDREAAWYKLIPLPTEPQRSLPPPDDYFVEEVKQLLLADRRLGDTPQERYNAVFQGGLRVYTTLDPRLQEAAEVARDEILPPQWMFAVALASVEPSSGAVRAMVGGPGFDQFKFNLATQGSRQTGSSFKTFVLVSALEHGAVPDDQIDGSSPCTFKIPGERDYVVRSAGGSGTVRQMTARSINCAYVRLGQIVGLDRVIETAWRLGVTTKLEPVVSLPLGVIPISPLEMASAYGTLANDGVRNNPYYIERVEDSSGNVLFQHEPDPVLVLEPDIARLATDTLTSVITGGTGTRARLPDGRPAAGKTGTTEDNADAWFVGYTPQLSTAVWMGNPSARIPMSNVGGTQVTGGSFPTLIWQRYMAAAHEGWEVLPFAAPPRTRAGVRLDNRGTLDCLAFVRFLTDGGGRESELRRCRDGLGRTTTTEGDADDDDRPARTTTTADEDDTGTTTTTSGGGGSGTTTTSSPTTAPPTTDEPSPTTEPPTTAPPPTEPPTTAPPPTEPPTTAPLPTIGPPPTEPPVAPG